MSFNHYRHQGRPRSGFRRPNFGPRPSRVFNPAHLIGQVPATSPVEPDIISHNFSDFALSPLLLQNIQRKGYLSPTPIQDRCIPEILSGKDVIGIANTGTGKTAAFLIPVLTKILTSRQEKALIVCPTRELATQIQAEFYSLSQGLKVLSVLCIGGVNPAPQVYNLRRNFNVVVGTPGRLNDHVEHNHLNLSQFTTIILDEADLMVDMGFLPDVKRLIAGLPAKRQSLFFSATINGQVQSIINTFVKNPVTISAKKESTLHNIHQQLIKVIQESKKIDQLHDLLIQAEFKKVLIFGRTKHGTQKLSEELIKRGFKADVIHGNKSQGQRQRTLDRFKSNSVTILVATDVASRGLDIPHVSHVINYDLPESSEAYIHRIGRTGRAQQKGVALTFV